MPKGQYKKIVCDKCNFEVFSNAFNRHYTTCDGVNGPNIKPKTNLKRVAWNKGLTKDTDERLHQVSVKTKGAKRRKLTNEEKIVFTEKLRKALENKPRKSSWSKSTKFISIPCEQLKKYLSEKGIKFVEEYQPLSTRKFSIDIAFRDIKLGIEVNGNQHYESSGILKPYYQDRHDLIESSGWKLIELHYTSCFKLDEIEQMLLSREQPDYTQYFNQENKINKTGKIYAILGQTQLRKSKEKWEPFVPLIMNSKIDFSKFGWVKHVAEILKISPQKVSSWMKRYMSDFYDHHCFKRRS